MILRAHGLEPATRGLVLCRMWKCASGGWASRQPWAMTLLKPRGDGAWNWLWKAEGAPRWEKFREVAALEERVREEDAEPFLAGTWMTGWVLAFANGYADGKGPHVTLYYSDRMPRWSWR